MDKMTRDTEISVAKNAPVLMDGETVGMVTDVEQTNSELMVKFEITSPTAMDDLRAQLLGSPAPVADIPIGNYLVWGSDDADEWVVLHKANIMDEALVAAEDQPYGFVIITGGALKLVSWRD